MADDNGSSKPHGGSTGTSGAGAGGGGGGKGGKKAIGGGGGGGSTAAGSTTSRNKKDPLSLYMQYRNSWDKHKPPGMDSRLKLRWDIREQLHHEDSVSAADKEKKCGARRYPVNTYAVPTDKSRMKLRWQIRMDLAHGIVPGSTESTGQTTERDQHSSTGKT